MITKLLKMNEGRTLEFKENTSSLRSIAKSVISLANTGGGTIVIGINDKTKNVVGLENSKLEAERIDRALADIISPLLIPEILPDRLLVGFKEVIKCCVRTYIFLRVECFL